MAETQASAVLAGLKRLEQKIEALAKPAEAAVSEVLTPVFWEAHVGWAVACAACAFLGFVIGGLISCG